METPPPLTVKVPADYDQMPIDVVVNEGTVLMHQDKLDDEVYHWVVIGNVRISPFVSGGPTFVVPCGVVRKYVLLKRDEVFEINRGRMLTFMWLEVPEGFALVLHHDAASVTTFQFIVRPCRMCVIYNPEGINSVIVEASFPDLSVERFAAEYFGSGGIAVAAVRKERQLKTFASEHTIRDSKKIVVPVEIKEFVLRMHEDTRLDVGDPERYKFDVFFYV
jgi:hypothetical protein